MMRSPFIHRLIGRFRAVAKDRRAAAAVELALALPAMCLFIFGIIEVGYTLWLQNALDYSVAEAARCASINPTVCGTPAQIQTYAGDQSGYRFDPSVFSVAKPSCGNRVAASYPMGLSIPFVSVSLTLSAQACFPA